MTMLTRAIQNKALRRDCWEPWEMENGKRNLNMVMFLQMQPVATELAQRSKPSDSIRLPSTYKYSQIIFQSLQLGCNSTYY